MLIGKQVVCGGIVLLFVISAFPSTTGYCNHSGNDKIVNDAEISPLGVNLTVSPDNGVYWKSHKILPSNMILILHGKLTITAVVTGGYFNYVEFYINGVLQYNCSSPGPYYYSFDIGRRPFLKTSFTISAIGQTFNLSKEITVCRLFW